VPLEFGLAFGPVYVQDEDTRERPGYDANAWPGPRTKLLPRSCSIQVRGKFGKVGFFGVALGRDRTQTLPVVSDCFGFRRAAHSTLPFS
jgi:hypothetical protein